ncbi:MAG: hypothetical protein IJG84_00815 [Kiritimatiellae bacterium]|nr:hypothetical protein [Kiritimatiellia bacterium]
MKIRGAIGAVIRKIEAKPSIPVGVYFGVYMVSWSVAALAATHLVDPKCRLLAWLMPSSTFMYEDVCRGMEHVVLAVGVVAVGVVPFAMLCARRFRAALKTLLIGFAGIVASIAFSFLTEDMLFMVSVEMDSAREDAMRSAEVELRAE